MIIGENKIEGKLPSKKNLSNNMSTTNLHFKGIVFDMDGVVTNTAVLHKSAWKKTFDNVMHRIMEGRDFHEFTDADYYNYVDGRPRMQGIQSFLQTRNIELPRGNTNDHLDALSIYGIANRKNSDFLKLVEASTSYLYQSTVDFIKQLKHQNIRVAVATSSKNCDFVLSKGNISHLFDARVDGNDIDRFHLLGKPNPDMFLKAVELLDQKISAKECIVVEDALSGVEAGKRGGFGLVLGVNRINAQHERGLYEHGATKVIKDFSEIPDLHTLDQWFLSATQSSA